MALYYDNEVFEKYHALAISNPSQFVEGKTYYSNSYPEKFTFRGLQTNAEHYDSVGLVWKHAGGDEVEWVIAEYELFNNQPTTDSLSLSDRNIGAHYNPWLIFEDEAVMNACKEELEVTYEKRMIG